MLNHSCIMGKHSYLLFWHNGFVFRKFQCINSKRFKFWIPKIYIHEHNWWKIKRQQWQSANKIYCWSESFFTPSKSKLDEFIFIKKKTFRISLCFGAKCPWRTLCLLFFFSYYFRQKIFDCKSMKKIYPEFYWKFNSLPIQTRKWWKIFIMIIVSW